MRWSRLRHPDRPLDWKYDPDWPAGEDVRTVLVYSPCDGFHIWRQGWACPPGTHWALMPRPPKQATDEHEAAIRKHYGGPSPLA